MRQEIALRAACRRDRYALTRILDDRRARQTEAFQWAWERLEGWGAADNGEFRKWDFGERIDKAQQLAWWAINQPLWNAANKKRWPAAEDAA